MIFILKKVRGDIKHFSMLKILCSIYFELLMHHWVIKIWKSYVQFILPRVPLNGICSCVRCIYDVKCFYVGTYYTECFVTVIQGELHYFLSNMACALLVRLGNMGIRVLIAVLATLKFKIKYFDMWYFKLNCWSYTGLSHVFRSLLLFMLHYVMQRP